MDRKSLIGFGIIAVILTAWMTWTNSRNQQEAEIKKKYNDSVARVEAARKLEADKKAARVSDSLKKLVAADTTLNADSLKLVQEAQRWGMFSGAAKGKNEPVVLENEKMRVFIYPKGGRIGSVELKGYQTYKQKQNKSADHLRLFTSDSTRFGLNFFDISRRRVTTDSLYFTSNSGSFSVTGKDSKSVSFRLTADGQPDTYIEYKYTLSGNSDLVNCTVNVMNAGKMMGKDQKDVMLAWAMHTPTQEKSIDNQRMVSTLYFQIDGDEDVESLSLAESEVQTPTGDLKWVAFKQQYFTSVLIADSKFTNGSTFGVSVPAENAEGYVKGMAVETPVPVNETGISSFPMKFYFGTTNYKALKSYNLGLEKQVDLGFSLFGWLNKYAIMPIFGWLSNLSSNYGIIILLLTIIVKIVLFPIAYKSFLSSAKMRVLKPEIDEINEKFKDGDPMKKQQETMALYRKAGVNPMAGCIPLLLQLPILFALLRFFPTVFELRQSEFLWAEDLSTYDSILDLGFKIPFYGDHVSLFALLMTASTLLYTWMNQQMLATGNQLPGMKWLMYLMPVMFLGFLNSTSAALSYYYFLSNMITFLQMFLMRRFVDEGAIRTKIEENKKKPVKKSGLMQRLEAAQRERAKQLQQGQQNNKKKK
ncbi:MAG: membrane protein insertase YidC [Bacteroidia bacterium]|jgi:YidC/Oxa1 family membrane protein insertase|nr:membrane protein insertase YidC [Bacteroidia bacterium]